MGRWVTRVGKRGYSARVGIPDTERTLVQGFLVGALLRHDDARVDQPIKDGEYVPYFDVTIPAMGYAKARVLVMAIPPEDERA